MADEEQLKILKQGVDAWNRWKKENPVVIPDLSKANFDSINLNNAILNDSDLNNSNLNNSSLEGVDLSFSSLINTSFYLSDLNSADLGYADLRGADFSESIMDNTNLNYASIKLKSFLWRIGLTKYLYSLIRTKDQKMIIWIYRKFEHDFFKPTIVTGAQLKNIKLDSDPILYRDLQDEQFLDLFQEKHKFVYWFWLLSSNCGRSITLLAFWTFVIGILFGFLYIDLPYPSWLQWAHPKFVNYVNGQNFNPFWQPFYLSFVTMTTLGIASANPINTAGFFWHTLQNIIGFGLLGYLVAVIGDKFTRRSG